VALPAPDHAASWPSDPFRRRTSWTTLAVPVMAAGGLVAAAVALRFSTDDTFINFRYAANLAAGLGPVFNRGERVEGYTTPLWVFVLGGLHRLGAPIEATAHVIGIAAAAATVIAAGVVATRAAPGLGGVAGALAAVLIAFHPGVLFWTSSGMETPVFMLLVLAGVATATLGRTPGWGGLLCGLAALTRPEGMLFGAGVGAALAIRGGRGPVARFAAGVAGLTGLSELCRIAYYGAVLPNTFYAKVGLQVPHGLWYVWQFVRDGGWIFAVAPVALAGARRDVAVVWLLLIAAYLGWVISIGGDFLAFHRFVVPAVPLLAVLAALGVEALLGSHPRAAFAAAVLGVTVWTGLLRGSYAYAWSASRGMQGIASSLASVGTGLGSLPPGTTVAMVAAGAMPFAAGPGINVIDMLGLNDAHIARRGTRVADGLPAHARYDNEYVFARRPEIVLIAPPETIPPCSRPITAAAVRSDPCGTAFLGRVGIETGLYGRDCPMRPRASCPYALPVDIDLMSPERRALFETAYDRVSELPGVGRIAAYRRRDWRP
jgi:hypothetical protein